jgi:hypothetical protein
MTETLPVSVPTEDGVKSTFKVAEPPAAKVNPEEIPLALNPAPERATFEIETLEPPVLVIVTAKTTLLPIVTFP